MSTAPPIRLEFPRSIPANALTSEGSIDGGICAFTAEELETLHAIVARRTNQTAV